MRGSGQRHQIAGEDRIKHNKNQVRGFYQSLPSHPDVSRYFGLVQCDVLAPRGLYHPVLPFKCHNKLMFFFSVPRLRSRWSADVLVPTRGRTTHLHWDVGESGIGSGLGDGVQGRED